MPNTRNNHEILQNCLDNPDQLLSNRNRNTESLPTPSPSASPLTTVNQPPRLFTRLAESLTYPALQPGERILSASKSVAELYRLNPVPLNTFSPSTSAILADVLGHSTDSTRRHSFVPGSLSDTSGISIGTIHPMDQSGSSGEGQATLADHMHETTAGNTNLDSALPHSREESSENAARMAADNDDLRAELADLKAMIQAMANLRPPATPPSAEVRIATSTPAQTTTTVMPPPRPESTVHHELDNHTPESTVRHESSGNQPPFTVYQSPPEQAAGFNHGPRVNCTMPPYWAYPIVPAEREVLAKHLTDSEIPLFTCVYGDVAGFWLWRYRIEAKFKVKGLMSDEDRLKFLPAALAVL